MATSGRAARLRECLVPGRETQTYSRYEIRAYQTGDTHGLPLASAVPRTMNRLASTIDSAIAARSCSCVTFASFPPDRSHPYDSGRAETSSSSLDPRAQMRHVPVASGGRRLLDRHLDPARGARIDAALRRVHGTGRGQAASSTSTWLM